MLRNIKGAPSEGPALPCSSALKIQHKPFLLPFKAPPWSFETREETTVLCGMFYAGRQICSDTQPERQATSPSTLPLPQVIRMAEITGGWGVGRWGGLDSSLVNASPCLGRRTFTKPASL